MRQKTKRCVRLSLCQRLNNTLKVSQILEIFNRLAGPEIKAAPCMVNLLTIIIAPNSDGGERPHNAVARGTGYNDSEYAQLVNSGVVLISFATPCLLYELVPRCS